MLRSHEVIFLFTRTPKQATIHKIQERLQADRTLKNAQTSHYRT